MSTEDLQQLRARFAQEIGQLGQIRSAALVAGLASVAREDFVGPGPWKIMRGADIARGYQVTPDADPRHLCQNVLVALDEHRKLNNGEPLGLLLFLDLLSLSEGDRVLHIGCGVGYYTAIVAHAVGSRATVVAVEIDPALAARAKINLRPYANVTALAEDGTLVCFGSFDAIFINAGCTRPLRRWLDQLALGGRLLIPMTVGVPSMPNIGAGLMLLVTKRVDGYRARFTAPVGIFHCAGARSTEEEVLLAKAYAAGHHATVCKLQLDAHEPASNCWLHAAGFCLQSAQFV